MSASRHMSSVCQRIVVCVDASPSMLTFCQASTATTKQSASVSMSVRPASTPAHGHTPTEIVVENATTSSTVTTAKISSALDLHEFGCFEEQVGDDDDDERDAPNDSDDERIISYGAEKKIQQSIVSRDEKSQNLKKPSWWLAPCAKDRDSEKESRLLKDMERHCIWPHWHALVCCRSTTQQWVSMKWLAKQVLKQWVHMHAQPPPPPPPPSDQKSPVASLVMTAVADGQLAVAVSRHREAIIERLVAMTASINVSPVSSTPPYTPVALNQPTRTAAKKSDSDSSSDDDDDADDQHSDRKHASVEKDIFTRRRCKDPVLLTPAGTLDEPRLVYSRSSLEDWIARYHTSPMTGVFCTPSMISSVPSSLVDMSIRPPPAIQRGSSWYPVRFVEKRFTQKRATSFVLMVGGHESVQELKFRLWRAAGGPANSIWSRTNTTFRPYSCAPSTLSMWIRLLPPSYGARTGSTTVSARRQRQQLENHELMEGYFSRVLDRASYVAAAQLVAQAAANRGNSADKTTFIDRRDTSCRDPLSPLCTIELRSQLKTKRSTWWAHARRSGCMTRMDAITHAFVQPWITRVLASSPSSSVRLAAFYSNQFQWSSPWTQSDTVVERALDTVRTLPRTTATMSTTTDTFATGMAGTNTTLCEDISDGDDDDDDALWLNGEASRASHSRKQNKDNDELTEVREMARHATETRTILDTLTLIVTEMSKSSGAKVDRRSRIVLITDGRDRHSRLAPYLLATMLQRSQIALDVLQIGSEHERDDTLVALSRASGGFYLIPRNMRQLRVMAESDHVISAGVRMPLSASMFVTAPSDFRQFETRAPNEHEKSIVPLFVPFISRTVDEFCSISDFDTMPLSASLGEPALHRVWAPTSVTNATVWWQECEEKDREVDQKTVLSAPKSSINVLSGHLRRPSAHAFSNDQIEAYRHAYSTSRFRKTNTGTKADSLSSVDDLNQSNAASHLFDVRMPPTQRDDRTQNTLLRAATPPFWTPALIKRIVHDAAALFKTPIECCTLCVPNEAKHLFQWIVLVSGPARSWYEGGCWRVECEFTPLYPDVPPTLRFMNRIRHPSVYPCSGRVCLPKRESTTSRGTSVLQETLHSLVALLRYFSDAVQPLRLVLPSTIPIVQSDWVTCLATNCVAVRQHVLEHCKTPTLEQWQTYYAHPSPPPPTTVSSPFVTKIPEVTTGLQPPTASFIPSSTLSNPHSQAPTCGKSPTITTLATTASTATTATNANTTTTTTSTTAAATTIATTCAYCGHSATTADQKTAVKIRRCGECRKIGYCSIDCQRSDWPMHQKTCKK